MDVFAKNLRRRAQELGLANAEVARRAGLSERRYAHYVSGRNEPDLAMLLRIAEVLQSTPNDLLSATAAAASDPRTTLLDRLNSAATLMTDSDLQAAIAQAEAVVRLRRR
ncbi:helix-turn-helix domain-containing protein [Pseudohoeflea coraliihabitans]|uniref:Helix-turn-helix domain-containing protein n=1 Tax=Pseudohoeflea coraliihabitans TaxID=2860393 RepID=A0ABS6WJT8_9HYPH|nr:helix-turn-helix transcriptional regulator [Pseudohoeflea sp. DP4N28-3]MBW3096214.1 helix-turn-helix domain-containing protein [Pseudohoeflea sp. DP4N28-3]